LYNLVVDSTTSGPDGLMTPVVNYLTMAPGRDERNDLLFLGGQTGDQDFNGMQRIGREFMLVVEDNTPRQ